MAAALSYPVLPLSARKLWKQLNQKGDVSEVRLDDPHWDELITGTSVGKPEPIFPRLDKATTLAKLHELAETDYERDKPKEALKSVKTESAKAPEPRTPSPESRPSSPGSDQKITIDEFAKVDMRVGEVKSAERVPGAQKLLKLMVDIGSGVRQVVAGIAEYYQPEQLSGTKIILVANLQPRKLRGVESDGMLLAATVGEEGRPVLVTVREDAPNGSRLK
jgi:methionyl-tRNA synthetase